MSNHNNAPFIVDFESVETVPCPCGLAQRALHDCRDFPGTIHVTEFKGDSKRHYHKQLTETYYVLSVEPGAAIEIEGQEIPLKIGMCIVIPPGLRHRGIGHFKILNVVIPNFDPNDEWFD